MIVADFIRQRDKQLAKWFADGLLDDEILDLAQEAGFDQSIEGIESKRVELHGKTLQALAKAGAKQYSQIVRTHQSVRVHELNELADRLRTAIKACMDSESYSSVSKLSEVYMRCLRQIAEEVRDLEPVSHGVNFYLTMVQKAPPERRRQLIGKFQELKAVMEVQHDLALDEGDVATAPPVIEGHSP